MMGMGQYLFTAGAVVCLFPLLSNLPRCSRAILNDARIISKDPALRGSFEILYAYPGFWALFWYRLSHALLEQQIPFFSAVLPRLVMSLVRYATAIDIHPGACISGDGILIDHGAGLVVGETAVIGGGVTLYHGVTLGISGKKLPAGAKRHPTIGARVVIGAGAKVLGNIVLGEDVLVGANSVVTKPVPRDHTAVGVPARVLCHGSTTGKDVTGAAICELHRRLQKVEKVAEQAGERPAASTTATVRAEQEADDRNAKLQAAGEPRERPSAGKRWVVESVPVLLRSPREEQSAASFSLGPSGASAEDGRSDGSPKRFVLEEATVHPLKALSSPAKARGAAVAGDARSVEAGVGEILYSLRIVAEHEAVVVTG